MFAVSSDDITALLLECRDESRRVVALERVMALIYEDLKRLARRIRPHRADATLSTTALAHEAFLRLAARPQLSIEDRQHLFRSFAQAMRRLVVDLARERKALKRGGELDIVELPDDSAIPGVDARHDLVLDIDRALGKLAELDPRAVSIVECRYFAGLSEEETADALGLSRRTVQREWLKAKVWLRQRLEGGE